MSLRVPSQRLVSSTSPRDRRASVLSVCFLRVLILPSFTCKEWFVLFLCSLSFLCRFVYLSFYLSMPLVLSMCVRVSSLFMRLVLFCIHLALWETVLKRRQGSSPSGLCFHDNIILPSTSLLLFLSSQPGSRRAEDLISELPAPTLLSPRFRQFITSEVICDRRVCLRVHT